MRKAAKKAAKKVPRRPAPEPEWQPATQEPLEPVESAKDFQKDGGKRNRLLAILRDPAFREAQEILRAELEPSGDLPIFFNPDNAAARYHQHAGMKYFMDGLRRLSKEPHEKKPLVGKQLTKELPDT
jgi:hypothetical protein